MTVLAPKGIERDPYERKPNPIPNKTNPIANLTGPDVFKLELHILEKIGAKIIINREFKTENQEAGISVLSLLNSFLIIHKIIIHIKTKLKPRKN